MVHAVLFSLSGIFIKKLSPEIGIFEQIFYRAAFSMAAILMIYRPQFSQCFNRRAMPSLISRGGFGFLGVSSMFYAMSELPLGIAMVLTLSTPVFVMIAGHFLLSEKVSAGHFGAALITLLGVGLILDLNLASGLQARIPLPPAAIGLIGSLMTAFAFLSMRAALKRVGANVVVFWFSLANLIGAGAVALPHLTLPRSENFYLLAAICVLGLMSDITKTAAYKYAVAWFVSLVSLASVAFSIFWGWLVFGENIVLVQMLGIGIMLVGIVFTILKSRTVPGQ